MNLQELLDILTNKYVSLSQARTAAYNSGDISGVMKIDEDILNTQNNIQQIQNMLSNNNQ